MKEIKEQYEPIEPAFKEELIKYQEQRKFVRIHYFNEYHEYISKAAIIKEINWEAAGEFLVLNTGELVRLDKIVRFDEKPVPGYTAGDFTCDC